VDLLATTLWLPALYHRNQLAVIGMMWVLLGAVVTLSIGLFVFKEVLTWTQWIGIACAIVALVLLEQ
jgi:multidrug transporter EmrE-like cation transporter